MGRWVTTYTVIYIVYAYVTNIFDFPPSYFITDQSVLVNGQDLVNITQPNLLLAAI